MTCNTVSSCHTIYSKYSNDRVDEFKIRTDIAIDRAGRKIIRKVPLTEAAKEHVFSIRDAYLGLQEKYRGGDFEVNDCPGAAETEFTPEIVEEEPEEEPAVSDDLPESDFEGYEFVIYNSNPETNTWFTTVHVVAEEDSAEE